MCGIVGRHNLHTGPRQDLGLLNSMRDTMVHRGPDGAGSWISEDGQTAFGHRRLAIIDLSDFAAQPMQDPSGQICLTFNGEIYNHAQLRVELEAKGHSFKTDHSDTEVLLHSYMEWGIEAVHHFRGMFAFAIYDGRTKDLFMVRDRIGVKPLYWIVHNGILSFASEIKAILADQSIPRNIYARGVPDYLSFLALPAPQTLFEGISKLESGSYIHVNASGDIKTHCWWDALLAAQEMPKLSENETVERILEKIREAVSLRTIGDVPIGVFLSGGIDSSANAALFAEGKGQVKTFSIGYDQEYGSYANELNYAQMAANHVGANHHVLKLAKQDLQSFLPDMVYYQDEPIADPVCVPLYYVSKLARDNGVTVCQVGEGADELFCGYPGWKRSLDRQALFSKFNIAGIPSRVGAGLLGLAGKSHTQTYDHLMRASRGQPIFHSGAESLSHQRRLQVLSSDFIDSFRDRTTWDCITPIRNRFSANGGHGDLKWMSYLDLNFRLAELLLMRVDKMSMAVSLEARVPFLDHEFVQLALSIDEKLLTKDGTLKYILKKAVRGIIPDELIDRKKQGFGLPLKDWIMQDLEDDLFDVVKEFANNTGILRKSLSRKEFRSFQPSHQWTLANLAMWWDRMVRL